MSAAKAASTAKAARESKVSDGIGSTASVSLAELVHDLTRYANAPPTPLASLDALRVLSFIKAIEARGEGHSLGQWCEMIMGWDTERVFEAIYFLTEKGWIAPSKDGGR